MKIQTQLKAGGIGLNHNQTLVRTTQGIGFNHNQTQVRTTEGFTINHNQTEVRTVEKVGTCPADAGAAGGGAVVSSDVEAGGASTGTGTTQAEPQSEPGIPEGLSSYNHNQTFIRMRG